MVHQENKGCLLATQTGIKHSTGEYVCLVDSDDWYEIKYLQKVNEILCNHKVDMVIVNYRIICQDKETREFHLVETDEITDAKGAIIKFLQTTNYALWNKFVARERIKYTEAEQHFFDTAGKTTNLGDDLYLLMPVLCGCEKVYFLSECLYNYMIDDNSISHKNVKNHWNEVSIRNRLMQVTYDAIEKRGCMDNDIQALIQIDTVVLMMPNIMEILKNKKIDRRVLGELRNNHFYRQIVAKTRFSVMKAKMSKKRAMAFWIFNQIVRLPFLAAVEK